MSGLPHTSWRCPHTHGYLLQNLPGLAGKALMTGCPVQFQAPLLERAAFTKPANEIVVTVTDHGKFWEREKGIVEFVAREFPKSRKILSLHQDGRAFKHRWKIKHLWNPPRRAAELHELARGLGYELFYSEEPGDYVQKYRTVDGTFRQPALHAHLFLLGHAKASYLVRVDDRAASGFAESSDFPLFDPATFAGWREYDFERVSAAGDGAATDHGSVCCDALRRIWQANSGMQPPPCNQLKPSHLKPRANFPYSMINRSNSASTSTTRLRLVARKPQLLRIGMPA